MWEVTLAYSRAHSFLPWQPALSVWLGRSVHYLNLLFFPQQCSSCRFLSKPIQSQLLHFIYSFTHSFSCQCIPLPGLPRFYSHSFSCQIQVSIPSPDSSSEFCPGETACIPNFTRTSRRDLNFNASKSWTHSLSPSHWFVLPSQWMVLSSPCHPIYLRVTLCFHSTDILLLLKYKSVIVLLHLKLFNSFLSSFRFCPSSLTKIVKAPQDQPLPTSPASPLATV